MTDRKRRASGSTTGDARESSRSAHGDSSTHGGSARRGGFGDDQGTRIGESTPTPRDYTGPSSRPVNEGLEGAIFDESTDDSSESGERRAETRPRPRARKKRADDADQRGG